MEKIKRRKSSKARNEMKEKKILFHPILRLHVQLLAGTFILPLALRSSAVHRGPCG